MKKNKWMVPFLVGGATLLAVGCEREQSVETGGIPGSRVIFSALTSYENSDATRTEYSGIVFGPSELTGTTNQVERIDWVSNDTHKDKFTVNYVAGTALNNSADYVVSSVNEENYNSRAGVVEADRSHILEWAGGSEHKFYAMYPTNTVNSDARLTVNRFQGVLYPSQPQTHTQSVKAADGTGPSWTRRLPNMDYAYMVAYAGTDNGMISGNSVTLPFRPAVTTFEFRLRRNAGEGGANIRYFKMISETAGDRTAKALTGQYSFDITSGDARGALWAGDAAVTVPAVTDANRVITVDFGEEGAVLPEASTTDYLDFTIFALPVSYNNLKIQLIDVNEKTREVALNDKSTGQGHAFQGGKKYVITNSSVPGEWIYVIEEIPDIVGYGHNPMLKPFSVKSYKYTKTDEHGVPTQVFPVAWKTQYTLDGETWIDLTSDGVNIPGPDGKWNATFKTDNLTGIGIGALVDTEDRTASIEGIAQGTIEGDEAAAAQRAKLATHALRGTSTNPFDLSIHPTYGTDIDQETTRTTANCYIISAPGVYMFPCVYGNAITKGLENKSAYWPAAATDAAIIDDAGVSTLDQVNTVYNTDDAGWRAYTPRFYNAINREIASPYILEDIRVTGKNAAVIWQDTEEGHEIVPFDEGNVGIIQKSIGGKTVDFIWFKVEPDNIKPGNFVIALRGSVPGVLSETWNILWSWHIWVTADDLTPQTLGNYEVMPRNIGWFDSNNGSSVQWPIRQIQYRVIQVEEDPKGQLDEEPFLVKQIGEAESTEPSVGGNVYYQWGRKDPFLPSTPDNKNHVWSYNHDYEGKFTMEGSGILKKDLNADYLDYGAGIREPFNPFSNVLSLGSIGGPAYPLQQMVSSTWTINTEVRGNFRADQAYYLQQAGFCSFDDWYQLESDKYYHNNPSSFNFGPYTLAAKETLIATGAIDDSDFEERVSGSGNWYLTSRIIGPFTLDEALSINVGAPSYNVGVNWLCPQVAGYAYFYLPDDIPYPWGPYDETQKENLVRAGFTEPTWITASASSGFSPYPASMRSKASNPSNLWNSYIYDEQTAGPSDVNKFKTIYDPCPPGFTVPSKQVFIGTLPADQMVRDYHTGTGKPLTKEVPNPVTDVFPGLTKQLLNSGDVNDKKGMDVAGVFLPYTGARIFRFDDYVPGSYNGTTGHPTVLYAEGVGSCGYYWTDNPLKIEYRDLDANPKDYTNIRLHWFYFDGYALIFGEDTDGYITNDWNFQSYSRPTAFSIRPMKDPKVSY